jgi:ABC-type sulfate/molybdate transport systems ATPase subunit
MNLRYENVKNVEIKNGVENVVLVLGHGQIDDARITVLTGSDHTAQRAFLEIIAGIRRPNDGRLTYGALGTDDRWRYSPEVPKDRLALVQQKRGVLGGLFANPDKRDRGFLDALQSALAAAPDLLLVDEPDPPLSARTWALVDELLLKANREAGLTIVLICNDMARLARLDAVTLTFENGRIV